MTTSDSPLLTGRSNRAAKIGLDWSRLSLGPLLHDTVQLQQFTGGHRALQQYAATPRERCSTNRMIHGDAGVLDAGLLSTACSNSARSRRAIALSREFV